MCLLLNLRNNWTSLPLMFSLGTVNPFLYRPTGTWRGWRYFYHSWDCWSRLQGVAVKCRKALITWKRHTIFLPPNRLFLLLACPTACGERLIVFFSFCSGNAVSGSRAPPCNDWHFVVEGYLPQLLTESVTVGWRAHKGRHWLFVFVFVVVICKSSGFRRFLMCNCDVKFMTGFVRLGAHVFVLCSSLSDNLVPFKFSIYRLKFSFQGY